MLSKADLSTGIQIVWVLGGSYSASSKQNTRFCVIYFYIAAFAHSKSRVTARFQLSYIPQLYQKGNKQH